MKIFEFHLTDNACCLRGLVPNGSKPGKVVILSEREDLVEWWGLSTWAQILPPSTQDDRLLQEACTMVSTFSADVQMVKSKICQIH